MNYMNPSDVADSANGPAQPQLPPVPFPPVPQAGAPMTLPLPPNPGQAVTDSAQPASQPGVDATTQIAMPPVVDDGDLIEKEWVHKAQHIVARNRHDPFKQSEEMAALRADYMKQRYNKDIKLDT